MITGNSTKSLFFSTLQCHTNSSILISHTVSRSDRTPDLKTLKIKNPRLQTADSAPFKILFLMVLELRAYAYPTRSWPCCLAPAQAALLANGPALLVEVRPQDPLRLYVLHLHRALL